MEGYVASAGLPVRRDEATTPALADQWEADALEAIEAVTDPDAAEQLLRRIKVAEQAIKLAKLGAEREQRWGRVRLLGERRYGELLGPPKNAAEAGAVRGTDSSSAEREAQRVAREVASVPEETFNGYIDGAEQPTRAGLLREADKMAVHYSSQTDEWSTPPDFFAAVAGEFPFNLDVCALESSAKCARYFTPDDDGLAQDWSGVCWMNPPYGDEIPKWVEKAHDSALAGATVVALVPARVDTGWWWDYCRHHEIRFIRGRLKFGGSQTSAPFPSALVVFGHDPSVLWWEWRR